MSQIAWSDAMTTGNAHIDQQHKELIAVTQKLLTAIKKGRGTHSELAKQEAYETLAFLGRYVIEHFEYEEAMMERYDFPLKELNENEHRIFTYRLHNLLRSVESHGFTRNNVIKVETLLGHWLLHHIIEIDSQLEHCIKLAEQGVSTKVWNYFFKKPA